ncbi:MAG: hypothetical protein AAFX99_17075 [Myxococcota bacterium]
MTVKHHASLDDIRTGLIRVLESDANRKRLLVEGGAGYILFGTSPGSRGSRLQGQAAGGRHLEEGFRVSPQSAQKLGDAGLRQRRASKNYVGVVDLEAPGAVDLWTGRTVELLKEVYGADPEALTLSFRSEEQPVLNNQQLLDAMDTLAKKRDWASRTQVYMCLIQAQLVVALAEPHHGPFTSTTVLHEADTMAGLPVFAVFPDVDALDHYEPRGLDLAVLSGQELFPLLEARKLGSVLINPRGAPRGELYTNELWTIVQGIQRLAH